MIGSLTLDQLRVLVAIAEAGSFSAAGRELRRAQSAISQAVSNLEAIQGVELFDRRGHRPRLTDVGRVLVDQARSVLASATRFEAIAASTRAGVEPELTIAIDPLAPMARSNSPTLGHPKFPQAGRSDYDDSGVTAMRAAASLRRKLLPSNSSIAQRCMSRSRMVLAMVASPRYLPQSCTTRLDVMRTARRSL